MGGDNNNSSGQRSHPTRSPRPGSRRVGRAPSHWVQCVRHGRSHWHQIPSIAHQTRREQVTGGMLCPLRPCHSLVKEHPRDTGTESNGQEGMPLPHSSTHIHPAERILLTFWSFTSSEHNSSPPYLYNFLQILQTSLIPPIVHYLSGRNIFSPFQNNANHSNSL